MEIQEIIKAVKGTYYNKPIKIKKKYRGIKTDTRKLEKNDIFIALTGPNFDGHQFLQVAIEKQAALIIIEREVEEIKENTLVPIILVKSTQNSLFDIARMLLDKFHTPVIAITGSVGKTTTKELIAKALEKKYNVLKSEGNKNNHIGVPETIFQLQNKHDVVVLEFGMNHAHEIEKLSTLVKPNIAIITNIGTSHIGNLGSIENIKKAKLEITSGMEQGILIINKDDSNLGNVVVKPEITLLPVGIKNSDFSILKVNSTLEGSTFLLEYQGKYYQGRIALYGEKMFSNVALAIKTALLLKVDITDILSSFLEYQSMNQRMDIQKVNTYTIIDDCYNSSYESLMANLAFLASQKEHKVFILGDILELGEESQIIHEKIGKSLINVENTEIILVGEAMLFAHQQLKSSNWFLNNQEVIGYLKGKKFPVKTIFFFKGSRKMKLEEIKKELFQYDVKNTQ